MASSVECYVDEFNGLTIRGWASDVTSPARPPTLYFIVDDQQVATIVCDVSRPEVASVRSGPDLVGYQHRLPVEFGDGKLHRLTIRDIRRREVTIMLDGRAYAWLEFQVQLKAEIQGHVDGLRHGGLEGWVMRTPPGEDTPQGNCMVRITCDGATVGHVRANQHRGDAARALGGPSDCGFRFKPPSSLRAAHARNFRFFVMPDDVELGGSPYTTSLVQDGSEARLLELIASVDAAHRDLTRIRRMLRELVPQPSFSVAEYQDWFTRYEPALRRHVAERRPADGWAEGPLVSVVCPVYRPKLSDLRTAVTSVLEQSYTNLELILVDDNSRRPELTALLAEFAEDPRVRVIAHKKNRGISEATNTALSKARGAWVAFFDHDDMLVDVALECMVAAARSTGATVLYSDEDKIDASGRVLHPAFKPDWNHRLMLGVNYVCHLLFVRRDVLEAVGPLRSRYDGAQDHDLILRLGEHVGGSAIHHVPEVLYHWRITAGSTADTMTNKSYASAAGIAVVTDHLERLGSPAVVSSIDDQSLYTLDWTLQSEPTVSIIIPYKDQIETTRRCVTALLDNAGYQSFRIVLVDNWSTSPESETFRDEMAAVPGVDLLRIEEDFNYSRLNNLATEQFPADYFMFMNNDLFVRDKDWLKTLVGEAEADATVGAVGGKFFYPDGSIQHGGVVLGIGGVAGHVHTGLRASDSGYAGRLLFAQEMSAVTAAGMLVRASAFEKAGRFDEVSLRVAFNDIDLCLKLRRAGYKIVWTPQFVADHYESLSRGDDERPAQEARFFEETETMKERWGGVLARDPFYHPRFALDRQPFFDLNDPETFE